MTTYPASVVLLLALVVAVAAFAGYRFALDHVAVHRDIIQTLAILPQRSHRLMAMSLTELREELSRAYQIDEDRLAESHGEAFQGNDPFQRYENRVLLEAWLRGYDLQAEQPQDSTVTRISAVELLTELDRARRIHADISRSLAVEPERRRLIRAWAEGTPHR